MTQPCRVKHKTQTALDACKMARSKITRLVTHTAVRQRFHTHEVGQIGYIDFHRARGGTQAIAGTGLIALIAVLLNKSSQALRILSRLTQVGNFALDDDALARGQSQTTRQAVHLTEATLDTFVGLEDTLNSLTGAVVTVTLKGQRRLEPAHLEFGQGLEMFDETFGVIVEDDAGVEQVIGVKYLLQLAHGGKSLLTPFILDKRSHVAACAMLRLQRAVIFLDHKASHVTHHGGIALHLALLAEELVDDEVVIALKGVAIDTGVRIAVVGNETLQFDGRLGQVLDGKGDVFDEARGAHGTCTAHAGEDARSDSPILSIDGRVGGKGYRDIGLELRQALGNGVNAMLQVLGRHGLSLGEDSSEVMVITRFHTLNLTSINVLLVLQIDRIIYRSQ